MATPVTAGGSSVYQWRARGDINAYFAFLLDCVVNLFVLSALLAGFGFPMEFVFAKIIPGAVVAIVLGNMGYAWLAWQTAKETGNRHVTAVPCGIDLTTLVGFIIAVIGPVFLAEKALTGDPQAAARTAWYVGMAGCLWIGLIKAFLSLFSRAIQRFFPPAALIGTIVGIAMVWLGANAMFGVLEMPTVGLMAFVIMAVGLIAGHTLPWRIPGAVFAVAVGTTAYYILGGAGVLDALGHDFAWPVITGADPHLASFTTGGPEAMFGRIIPYLPATLPFAVLVAASAINITSALKLVGDDYRPDRVIQVDAAATIIGSLFGCIIQTTPYFGHTTYKRMGGHMAYSLGVGLTILVGGLGGIISILIALIPAAVIKPILIVVAFDIVRLAFEKLPSSHAPAVAMAALPAILNFCQVKIGELLGHVQAAADSLSANINTWIPVSWLTQYELLTIISRGYIITALVWAATMSFIIERRLMLAAAMMAVCSVAALFGVIHSADPSGGVYLPWSVDFDAATLAMSLDLAVGYGLAGAVLAALHYLSPAPEVEETEQEDG